MATDRFIVGASEVSNEDFGGFVCIATTTITEIGYGLGKYTPASPNNLIYPTVTTGLSIIVQPGTQVPMRFSHIKITSGTLALLK